MQSALWHSWEFGGWYRRVPYGTLGRERVNLMFNWEHNLNKGREREVYNKLLLDPN